MSAKDDAKALVDNFAAVSGGTVWLNIQKIDIVTGLKERIDDPAKINQSSANVCGPASFLYNIATDDPKAYAQAVIDLYGKGRTRIKNLEIKSKYELRTTPVPPTATIAPVDWIILASIRDSDNWFLHFTSPDDGLSAITMPHTMESWLKDAGYTDIVNDTSIYFTRNVDNVADAIKLYNKGYKVLLFINDDMLYAKKMNNASTFPSHWIALTSEMSLYSGGKWNVSFTAYSWGDGHRSVPESGTLSLESFLNNYYGYIACRR